jgi:hypothetical protein
MIDTVRLKQSNLRHLSFDELESTGANRVKRFPSKATWSINGAKNSGEPRKPITKIPDCFTLVEVEASTPRMLYSLNAGLPTEPAVVTSVEQLCAYVVTETFGGNPL